MVAVRFGERTILEKQYATLRVVDGGERQTPLDVKPHRVRLLAKHRGSGILPFPDEVRTILDQVLPQLKPRLSIKMRLGLNSPQEIFALIPVLNDYPLANVTIHPRTGRQQYGGQVDLDTFLQVLPLLHHHIIYNGDLCTLDDYRRLHRRFPQITDFMIGRGVLYDPLLPLRIKEEMSATPLPSHTSSVAFITTLLDGIAALPMSDISKMRKIKEYWCLIRRSIPITEQQAYTVLHAQDYLSTRAAVTALLNSV